MVSKKSKKMALVVIHASYAYLYACMRIHSYVHNYINSKFARYINNIGTKLLTYILRDD